MVWNRFIERTISTIGLALLIFGRAPAQVIPMENDPIGGPGQPLTIEVWSDVVCPFCYIGKRELENALERFPHKDSVRVVWKSFELDPEAPARAEQDTYGMLSERYGMTREQAKQRVETVVQRAATVGLTYHFDRVIVGHSFDAHRLLQFAKTKGTGDGMKERLFKAYFTEGQHLADQATLVALATEVGLDAKEVDALLSTDAFTDAVRADEAEATGLGISGVPFFVFDRRLAVSGAQDADVFLQAIQQAWDGR